MVAEADRAENFQVGGFLGETGGWRWVAALIAIFTALLTAFGFLIIPETYAPVLLRARAQRLSQATGRVYRSKFEKDKEIRLSELFKTALGRPWVLLFREPIVFLLSLYLAIVYATLYVSLVCQSRADRRCCLVLSPSCFKRPAGGARASAAWPF